MKRKIMGVTVGTPISPKIIDKKLEIGELRKQVNDLATSVADLLYTAIDITKFSHNSGTNEIGSVVKELTLSWTLNKAPTTQTVDGVAVDVSERSKKLTGLEIKTNKTFTLTVTDEREATDSSTTTVSFQNGVYYGASAMPGTLDNTFILGLKKELSGNKGRTITVTAGDGQHIWYALPSRLGACRFAVGGFSGGFDLVNTIDFTNASGYTEAYYVYASAKTGLGETKVVVS